MPRKSKEATERVCAECGASFFSTIEKARFCMPAHQKAFGNRQLARGAVIMPYVMAWIEGRGGGHSTPHPVAKRSMGELTKIVRDFLDDDKAAGRPPAVDYAESLFASGFLYCDRKRRR